MGVDDPGLAVRGEIEQREREREPETPRPGLPGPTLLGELLRGSHALVVHDLAELVLDLD